MTDEQIQSLIQLKDLKEQGILTQEEFEKAKKDLLNGTADQSNRVERESQDKIASSFNTTNLEGKTISRNGNHAKSTEKNDRNRSWFARNWEYIALVLAYPLIKVLMLLAR